MLRCWFNIDYDDYSIWKSKSNDVKVIKHANDSLPVVKFSLLNCMKKKFI